jgi:hypothetical protein
MVTAIASAASVKSPIRCFWSSSRSVPEKPGFRWWSQCPERSCAAARAARHHSRCHELPLLWHEPRYPIGNLQEKHPWRWLLQLRQVLHVGGSHADSPGRSLGDEPPQSCDKKQSIVPQDLMKMKGYRIKSRILKQRIFKETLPAALAWASSALIWATLVSSSDVERVV